MVNIEKKYRELKKAKRLIRKKRKEEDKEIKIRSQNKQHELKETERAIENIIKESNRKRSIEVNEERFK